MDTMSNPLYIANRMARTQSLFCLSLVTLVALGCISENQQTTERPGKEPCAVEFVLGKPDHSVDAVNRDFWLDQDGVLLNLDGVETSVENESPFSGTKEGFGMPLFIKIWVSDFRPAMVQAAYKHAREFKRHVDEDERAVLLENRILIVLPPDEGPKGAFDRRERVEDSG